MITTIIFDIGNVMVAYDWKGYLASFGFSEEKYKAIADAMFLSDTWNEMDRGVLTYDEILARFIRNAPQYAQDIPRVLAGMGNTIRQFAYAKPWIRELREKGYRVFYLSNYGEFALQETKKELDFCHMTNGGLFSYETKMVKPNRWIYAELCRRYDIVPQEAVFLDDTARNVAAAEEFGMHGIVFSSYEQARRKLAELGVV